MTDLVDLTLHNVAVIKDATLPLDRVGITVIHGLNKDASTGPNSPDANAAGKSLLLKGLPELIFASNPLTQEIKSKAKKDLFTHKDSFIRLRAKRGKSVYSFTKKAKGKSFAYELEKDGKDIGVRTIKYPEEKIRSFFGMTEEEFYTLYYIDSGRQSSLQYGMPSKRLEFFTNLFRLNNYDEVRKLFNGLMREAKENSAVIKEILSQLDAINNDLPKESLKELSTELDAAARRSKEMTDQFQNLQSTEAKLTFAIENQNNYKILMGLVADLELEVESASDLSHTMRWARSKLAKYKQAEKAANALKAYAAEMERYESKRRKIVDDLRAEGFSIKPQFVVSARDKLEKYKAGIEALRARIKELEESREALPKPSDLDKDIFNEGKALVLKKLKMKPEDAIEHLSSEKSKILTKRSELKEQIETLESLKKSGCSTCPTCSQQLTKSATAFLISELQDTYDTLGQHTEKATRQLNAVKYYAKHEPEVREYEINRDKSKKIQAKLDELKEDLEEQLGRKEKFASLASMLARYDSLVSMEKPEKPDVEAGDYDESKVEKLTKFISVAEVLLSGFDRLHEVDFAEAKRHLKRVQKTKDAYTEDLKRFSSKIPELTAKLQLAKKLTKQREDLLEKHRSLQESVDDIPLIEMLIEAYSNKGIKLLLIRQIASLIEKNMNQYAPLLYSEPTKFHFEVIDERNFNILIERKIQNKTSVSDVRTLSGAERRAFTFLLPLAIMPLIPHERRLNVMVLDEPTVNMSPARINLFTRGFIPKLNTVVPHIVIITPQQEHYDNSVKYLVTKHKGVSTLAKL